jgi:hypothetical protein
MNEMEKWKRDKRGGDKTKIPTHMTDDVKAIVWRRDGVIHVPLH